MTRTDPPGLSEEELKFYSRQIVLQEIGYNGQLKLKNAKVCLVGLGGLGSPAAMQLTAIGVGHLRLVDCDVVELSNLQRQILYDTKVLGYPKVEVATERLRDLNPNIIIEPIPISLNSHNAADIIKGMDVVVDGLDRMTPRYAVNRVCNNLGIPYIFGAAIMNFGNVSTIIPQKTPCLECFQGNLEDAVLPTCAVVGVHPSVLSIIASIEVSEAVRLILGEKPNLAGKILHCDIDDLVFEEIVVSRAENCPVCGSKSSRSPMSLDERTITESCSRNGKRVFVITPREDLNLDMNRLLALAKKVGYEIKIESKLGLRFAKDSKRVASVLKSGVMIIEGADDEDNAYSFYEDLISENLGTPKPLFGQESK